MRDKQCPIITHHFTFKDLSQRARWSIESTFAIFPSVRVAQNTATNRLYSDYEMNDKRMEKWHAHNSVLSVEGKCFLLFLRLFKLTIFNVNWTWMWRNFSIFSYMIHTALSWAFVSLIHINRCSWEESEKDAHSDLCPRELIFTSMIEKIVGTDNRRKSLEVKSFWISVWFYHWHRLVRK